MSDHILVLGAGGFVGRHLVRALARRGERVIAVSRQPVDAIAGVEFIVASLVEPEHFMPLLARSRAVVHLASRSTPGSSAGRPLTELDDNLRPTLALLQALQEQPNTNLLYLSSGGSVYGANSNSPSTEAAALEPRSYHGAGKVASEHFISAWCSQYGGAATILRPSNIYGPGQNERAGFGIVPTVFGKITRDEILAVWGDGSAVRDYLYIDDLVKLCEFILAAPMPAGVSTLNAASGIGVSLNDLLHAMEEIAGKRLPRTYQTQRAVDARLIVMDPSLAYRHYGWSAATSLQDGLRQTWKWFTTLPR